MFVTYSFWIKAQRVHKGGASAGGDFNYQLDMRRESALALYQELKKEFG